MAAEQPPQQPHESVHIWIILVELEQSLDAASSFDKLPVLKYAIPNWLRRIPCIVVSSLAWMRGGIASLSLPSFLSESHAERTEIDNFGHQISLITRLPFSKSSLRMCALITLLRISSLMASFIFMFSEAIPQAMAKSYEASFSRPEL